MLDVIDLAACRAAITAAFAAVAVNVYAYPPTQPEYPALVLGPFEQFEYHATVAGGERVEWRAELFVAYADSPEQAIGPLEEMVAAFPLVLDTIPEPHPWASITARRAERVRERDGRALSVDVVLELTA